jgi:hypothetical protein
MSGPTKAEKISRRAFLATIPMAVHEVTNLAKNSNSAALKSNLRTQLHEIFRSQKVELNK